MIVMGRARVLFASHWILVLSSLRTSCKASHLPNIVILFADNLGYADVGVFGSSSTSRTPFLDSLAQDGIKFGNWNSAAHLCSASRAALLTAKYPVRTGIYPGVFKPDAVNGLLPTESTLAEYLKEEGFATSIVGKWHLGHRPDFLPTNQGFDEWLGIPYHMSGGSIDEHTCIFDENGATWLPLYQNTTIIQQPVHVNSLALRYALQIENFIQRNANRRPFFLYVPFSHVHQLCAPRDLSEQSTCQWSHKHNSTFADSLEEMDWIAGRVLLALEETGASNDTLVLFTSDNGPWVAEQKCSGQKGPFEGRCPTVERPRQCILPGTMLFLDGVHCGQDSGLGSLWEANLRMPALARWPGRIPPGSETMALVSTLDVLPTVLSVIGKKIDTVVDGMDISSILFGDTEDDSTSHRLLFFWRDGFDSGPLPPPYGRFDVAAVKYGRFKIWLWTKSAHYNNDSSVYHDPPLLFDTLEDPGEAYPLDVASHSELIDLVRSALREHKASVDWTFPGPLALARDPRFVPCSDRENKCRTRDHTSVK